MSAGSRWVISNEEQGKLISNLTENLLLLRAKLEISQEELACIIGTSRQTYSSIESKKRIMTWQTYLSLIFFFDGNQLTHKLLHHLGCYPENLVDKPLFDGENDKDDLTDSRLEILSLLSKLDGQALHSVKAMLMIEYARCSQLSGDEVVKAFDGVHFKSNLVSCDVELKQALNNIKGES